MRGSSFNEEESGVGLALEQHSTRLKGMMGCPFGCSYSVYSVQRGGILLVYVGYSECSSRRHICFEEIHRCNPNQLGGFACDYVRDFPIEVNPIFAYLGTFLRTLTLFAYCQIQPRRAISDPHLLEQIPSLAPNKRYKWPHTDITICGAAIPESAIRPLVEFLHLSGRLHPILLLRTILCYNRLFGEHVIFWGIDSVNNKNIKKKEKTEAEAGKIAHCRVQFSVKPRHPPFHHNPTRAPTYVEGGEKIFLSFQLH